MTQTRNHTQAVLAEIHMERLSQDAHWGVQNHPTFLPGREKECAEQYRLQADIFKALNDARIKYLTEQGAPPDRNCTFDTILGEELFEALAEIDPAKRRAELIQTAAVAVCMIEAIDRGVY